MSFTSFHFLMFFPLVAGLYFVIPYRLRWILLLGASYYFYMSWKPWYIVLILFTTVVSYACGRLMEASDSMRQRKIWMAAGTVATLGLLFFFKYFNFFNIETADLMASLGVDYNIPNLHIVLPVAISFYTFQVLSYLIDVYMGRTKAEHHFGIYALYVVFFPQLVAGPIERSFHFLPQLRLLLEPRPAKELSFHEPRVTDGLRLMLRGFFKKIVIADNVGIYVDAAYANPGAYGGATMGIATVLFAIQIYCDFSAYTDIARGVSRIMGIELIENFRRPYFARSIPEFWRRWHISLTSWFRDYLYIPLGGNRVSEGMWAFNVTLVFLLSGLWHGANWTFVVWGVLHGTYFFVSKFTENFRGGVARAIGLAKLPNLHATWQVLVTFALVCFAWVFFRAPDITTAFSIVTNMGTAAIGFASYPFMQLGLIEQTQGGAMVLGLDGALALFKEYRLLYTLMAIVALALYELVQERKEGMDIAWFPRPVRWVAYYAGVLAIIVIGNIGQEQFIYFQF